MRHPSSPSARPTPRAGGRGRSRCRCPRGREVERLAHEVVRGAGERPARVRTRWTRLGEVRRGPARAARGGRARWCAAGARARRGAEQLDERRRRARAEVTLIARRARARAGRSRAGRRPPSASRSMTRSLTGPRSSPGRSRPATPVNRCCSSRPPERAAVSGCSKSLMTQRYHLGTDPRVLVGRDAECSAIDNLIDAARSSNGGALVLRGRGRRRQDRPPRLRRRAGLGHAGAPGGRGGVGGRSAVRGPPPGGPRGPAPARPPAGAPGRRHARRVRPQPGERRGPLPDLPRRARACWPRWPSSSRC